MGNQNMHSRIVDELKSNVPTAVKYPSLSRKMQRLPMENIMTTKD